MMNLRQAIAEWEEPLGETMIRYSALIRKARTSPSKIFVAIHWCDSVIYEQFDVGLVKKDDIWIVDKFKFRAALTQKIKYAEHTNTTGRTHIQIKYPKYLTDRYSAIKLYPS